jgi:hypothetical protein
LPKENRLFSALVYRVIRKDRRLLIRRFLDASQKYLSEGGRLLIVLRYNELDLLTGGTHKVIDDLDQQKLICWNHDPKD